MGVGGVMTLKVTGIVTITEITQKTSGPPSQISLQEALMLAWEAPCQPERTLFQPERARFRSKRVSLSA